MPVASEDEQESADADDPEYADADDPEYALPPECAAPVSSPSPLGPSEAAASVAGPGPGAPGPVRRRQFKWGPFEFHELKGGGMSAHCDRHQDCSANGDKCRASLLPETGNSVFLPVEEKILRLKRWLVFGIVHCPPEDEESREKHLFKNKARKFTTNPTAEDLAQIPEGMFADGELDCLR